MTESKTDPMNFKNLLSFAFSFGKCRVVTVRCPVPEFMLRKDSKYCTVGGGHKKALVSVERFSGLESARPHLFGQPMENIR